MTKKLSNILKIFTKTQKELSSFIDDNSKEQVSIDDRIAELVLIS